MADNGIERKYAGYPDFNRTDYHRANDANWRKQYKEDRYIEDTGGPNVFNPAENYDAVATAERARGRDSR